MNTLKSEAGRGGAPAGSRRRSSPGSVSRQRRMGEDIAAEYLTGHGFKILDRNVKIGRCEVDIIARDGDELVSPRCARAAGMDVSRGSVGPKKLANLNMPDAPGPKGVIMTAWRVDLVSVTLAEGRSR
ncbi:MAG: YraN family protein [Cloacibacillus evryensis]